MYRAPAGIPANYWNNRRVLQFEPSRAAAIGSHTHGCGDETAVIILITVPVQNSSFSYWNNFVTRRCCLHTFSSYFLLSPFQSAYIADRPLDGDRADILLAIDTCESTQVLHLSAAFDTVDYSIRFSRN